MSMEQGRVIGYARIGPNERNRWASESNRQRFALEAAGCKKVFVDKRISGWVPPEQRPGLSECLAHLLPGDTFAVWKLDRLGRNANDVLQFVEKLKAKEVTFRSVTEGLSTEGPMGSMFFQVLSVIVDLEREVTE